MIDFIIRLIGLFLLFTFASWIGTLIRKKKLEGDLENLPDPDERKRLLKMTRQLRAEGSSYNQCIEYLVGAGLRKGVAESYVNDVEREQPADVTNKNMFNWNGLKCEYPGNWKVVKLDDTVARDTCVSIEDIGGAALIFSKLTTDISYDEMVAKQLSELEETKRTEISSWGHFKGEGVIVKGILKKCKLESEITVFQVSENSVPFILVQIFVIEETELVTPGFDLIKATLC